MITDEKIARINALAQKSRTPEGLTQAEQAEQAALRREYVDAVKASLELHLDNAVILRPDGTKETVNRNA